MMTTTRAGDLDATQIIPPYDVTIHDVDYYGRHSIQPGRHTVAELLHRHLTRHSVDNTTPIAVIA